MNTISEKNDLFDDKMQAIIREAYQIFKVYLPPQTFDVCFPCCVSKKELKELQSSPVASLSFGVFNSYNQSGQSNTQNSDEIRYLLPRLLELIAQGQYPGITPEISLQRVGRAHPETWRPKEQAILTAFACQHIQNLMNRAQAKERLEDELDCIIIMFHLAGLDIAPILDTILDCSGFWPIASLAFMLIMERQNSRLDNPFSTSDGTGLLDLRINDWIKQKSPILSTRIEALIVTPIKIDPEYNRYYAGRLEYWIEESLCTLHSMTT